MVNKTQMLKGILEGCVLKVVNRGPCYSGEIVQMLREAGFEDMAEGTLFPMLLRLEKEGLFETEKVANPLGPSRKYYQLSQAGKEQLEEFSVVWDGFRDIIDGIMKEGQV